MLSVARPAFVQPTNAWQDLFNQLKSNSGLSFFAVLAGIMWVLTQFGGLTIGLGGVLSLKNHLRSGKELIGLGTGVGLADLLLLAHSGTIGPYEWVGWSGLVLSVLAGRHIHGPEASYAGELRRLITTLRARLAGKNARKAVRRRHSRSLRAKRIRSSTAEYDVRNNKKRQSE